MAFMLSQTALERPAIIVPAALLLLAAAGGVMWAGFVPHAMPEAVAPVRASLSTPAILVSTTDIARGQMLTGRDYVLQPAAATAPAAALHRAEDADGHMALTAIHAGAPIQADQVSVTAVPGIAARVPEGYRAYALPVSEAVIAGGFLQTGDHVDLYITLPGALFAQKNAGGQTQDDQSKSGLLLQNIAVLAVGTKTDIDGKPDTTVRTVTLALNAADLAKVSLANRLGTISFAIRNPVDAATLATVSPAQLGALVGDAPKPAAAPSHKIAQAFGIPMLAGRARTTLHMP